MLGLQSQAGGRLLLLLLLITVAVHLSWKGVKLLWIVSLLLMRGRRCRRLELNMNRRPLPWRKIAGRSYGNIVCRRSIGVGQVNDSRISGVPSDGAATSIGHWNSILGERGELHVQASPVRILIVLNGLSGGLSSDGQSAIRIPGTNLSLIHI